MRLQHFIPFIGLTVVLLGLAPLPAQQKKVPGAPALVLDAQIRTEVIDITLAKLNKTYVIPDVAKEMEKAIRARLTRGDYDKVTNPVQFAQWLTAHLREVCNDKHLQITYSKKQEPAPPGKLPPTAAPFRLPQNNFGFEKCERMPGNIGYLDMRGFAAPQSAGDTFAAAMAFLANTDALIVDLRQSTGGALALVNVMCSYFFDQVVHLNDLYIRESDTTRQLWTMPYVEGKRYVGKDVYFLTSSRTISAAEYLPYQLQSLKRAIVIGEPTAGAAHVLKPEADRINDHFVINVPYARPIHPITKSNWEGIGVQPDIECPEVHALKIGHLAALKKLSEKTTDQIKLNQLKMFITQAEKEVSDLKKK